MTETLEAPTRTMMCPVCETDLVDGVCLNPNCEEAQAVATADATRETQKVASKTAGKIEETRTEPRSFSRSGYAD